MKPVPNRSSLLSDAKAVPRFTVVVPVYNDARRVRRAIQSVLDQTMPDFELIVIDDCSKDDSAAVVRQIKNPRLRLVLNESNLGCGGNKNKGLSLAAAPFFKALDSDDWLEPTYLERTLDIFQQHPDVALVTSAATEHRDRADNPTSLRANHGPGGSHGLHPGRAFQEHYFHGHSAGNPTQVAIRTEWARAAGGWDARLVNGDETALWLRIVRGRQAFFLGEPLVHISLHQASLTATASRTGLESRHIALMFRDALRDIPELNTFPNRLALVWTRGYQWFSRGQKLFLRRQFKDAFNCWLEIATFAPSLWWVPVFLLRSGVRALRKKLRAFALMESAKPVCKPAA